MSETRSDLPVRSDTSARTARDLATLAGRGRMPPALQEAGGLRRLDWILDLAEPREFVRSLATGELYFLVQDIGPSDAGALLELASKEQIQGILDLDLWSGHEVRIDRWLRWIEIAREAGLPTALRVIRATEPEMVQLVFTGEVQVHAKDLDLDTVPDELEIVPTPDGEFFVTIDRDNPLAQNLPELLRLLWAADMEAMRDIFLAARFELSSQVEETLLHFRRGRLEEMGFVAPDEALSVYAFLHPGRTREKVRASVETSAPFSVTPLGAKALDLALREATAEGLLEDALSRIGEEARQRFAEAFTCLVHKVFMAWTGDLSQTDRLAPAARHTAALSTLGLAWLADESPGRAALVVERLRPEVLFRVGYSLTIEIARVARRVRSRAGSDEGLRLFGEPTDDVLAGVSSVRPLYFEGIEGRGAETFRDFATLDELERVRVQVHGADQVLRFFEEHLGFSPRALLSASLEGLSEDDRVHLRLGTLFRTGLARVLLSGEFAFAPLAKEDLARFLALAFHDGAASPTLERALEDLVRQVPETVADWVRGEVEELRLALGRVREADLDPRYAAGLLLVRRGS